MREIWIRTCSWGKNQEQSSDQKSIRSCINLDSTRLWWSAARSSWAIRSFPLGLSTLIFYFYFRESIKSSILKEIYQAQFVTLSMANGWFDRTRSRLWFAGSSGPSWSKTRRRHSSWRFAVTIRIFYQSGFFRSRRTWILNKKIQYRKTIIITLMNQLNKVVVKKAKKKKMKKAYALKNTLDSG